MPTDRPPLPENSPSTRQRARWALIQSSTVLFSGSCLRKCIEYAIHLAGQVNGRRRVDGQDDDADVVFVERLLIREIAIKRDENRKRRLFGWSQKLVVLVISPAEVLGGVYVVRFREKRTQLVGNVMV